MNKQPCHQQNTNAKQVKDMYLLAHQWPRLFEPSVLCFSDSGSIEVMSIRH